MIHNLSRALASIIDGVRNLAHPAAKSQRPAEVEGYRVRQLSRALWRGFGCTAAKELTALQTHGGLPNHQRDEAAWALASWYHSVGEYQRAFDQLKMRRRGPRASPVGLSQILLEVDSLLWLGRYTEAKAIVDEAGTRWEGSSELCFSAANVELSSSHHSQAENDQVRLSWLNKPFTNASLVPLQKADASCALRFSNIAGNVGRYETLGPKVSVLMPAHNAEDTISLAIDSILNQSWGNLELLVVDDVSTDHTASIVESYCAKDRRVVLLKHSRNLGCYASRNTALRHATGDFVTTNDADDWSHPQRIALQVEHLGQSNAVCNTTSSVRVDEDLRVLILRRALMIREALPSLMVRREHVLELGGWDEVRMGGDTEFYGRLLARHRQSKTELMSQIPLMFQLSRRGSLTATSIKGYGARREYSEAYRYWHKLESTRQTPSLRMPPDHRPFPVPMICTIGTKVSQEATQEYDVLWVSDLTSTNPALPSVLAMLCTAQGLGLRSACVHWPKLESADKPVDIRVRKLLHQGVVKQVVAGERRATKLAFISEASMGDLPDITPDVSAENVLLIVDKIPTRHASSAEFKERIERSMATVRSFTSATPKLAPVSPPTRFALAATFSEEALTDRDWVPLVTFETRTRDRPLQHRRPMPVIAFDSRVRSRDRKSEESGLVQLAEQRGWRTLVLDDETKLDDAAAFDIFVYPYEGSRIDAWPYDALNAMAQSKPVIVPRHFEAVFSNAAAYYEDTSSIVSAIERLWRDRESYDSQVAAGLRFIEDHCSRSLFENAILSYFDLPRQRIGQ